MRTLNGGPCLHYDCSNRNSFGYCKTTVCINEHYQQEQWGSPSTTNKSEPTRAFDSFRVEEEYNWHNDVMEITSRIMHETDEARLSNIANHFEVDLSEIRTFLEMKQQQQKKPQTNADLLRAMTDEELAHTLWLTAKGGIIGQRSENEWLDWLKDSFLIRGENQ